MRKINANGPYLDLIKDLYAKKNVLSKLTASVQIFLTIPTGYAEDAL